jgi:hypothetical protein
LTVELELPNDFDQYGWEVESKGVYWGGTLREGSISVPVTFYDPYRLSQDLADELADGRVFTVVNLVVVERVTVDMMRAAAGSLSLKDLTPGGGWIVETRQGKREAWAERAAWSAGSGGVTLATPRNPAHPNGHSGPELPRTRQVKRWFRG